MQILYPEIEKLSEDKIREHQLKSINKILGKIKNTPYYKGKIPKKIKDLSEISTLPLLSKNDLRNAFPYKLLSCPQEKIFRISASSGTTGIPTLSYCTKKDLKEITLNEALHFSHAGITSKDLLQCMVGFNLFTAGWGCYHGLSELGAAIIPSGPGNTQRQIDLLKTLKPNYCYSTPGYLQYFLEIIKKEDWKDICLKVAITGGEVLTSEFQKLAKEKYNIEVYNFYGMTEFATHIASECHLHKGLHINEDYFYAEIINPETGDIVPDGEYGELVLTNLKREGMPLIRYRTGDVTRFLTDKCPCGRTHRRIEPIYRRTDSMLIINGVNVYPSQIEECIYKNINSATNYLIHVFNKNGLKKLVIDIELEEEILNNRENLKTLEKNLLNTLKSYITVTPILNFIKPKTMSETTTKAKRIVFEN